MTIYPTATTKAPKSFSRFLWLLPLSALGIALWLAFDRHQQLGESITIHFKNADGLEAGKTQIRYKNLTIGTVTDLQLSPDLSHIIATAQMQRTASPLLKKDSQFWVVRANIDSSGVSGLNTLLSGSYISVAEGISQEKSRNFEGLENPPLIKNSAAGLRLQLTSPNIRGIRVGSSIYYRGIVVGQIERLDLNLNQEAINLSAFIHAPYHQLINSNTRFFNISGIEASLSSSGANIRMQSLQSLVFGGITFNTPKNLLNQPKPAENGMTFALYPNEQASLQKTSAYPDHYILHFEDNIRGLKMGSAVNFNGLDVGKVIDIRVIYDDEKRQAVTPVLIELEPTLIERLDDNHESKLFDQLIHEGLHASLETGNLLTGEKYIKLSMLDKEGDKALTQDAYTPYLIMPTQSGGISKITDEAGEILNRINKLPIERLMNNIAQVMENIEHLTASDGFQNLPAQLQETLVAYQKLGKTGQQTAQSLNKELSALLQSLQKTLETFSPESNFRYQLQETLQAVEQTARGVNQLLNTLNNKPNALIFGE
ncbi:MAG: MlaD family protein [Cardiobacteriaceae bacterium]|nr:MlaD family protein [Cardiobacteriaceae bacterium]